MASLDIESMRQKIREIAKERDWDQYHTPKNLAISLSLEASELLEIFQWLNDPQVAAIQNDPKKMEAIRDELSDVLYWLLRLSDVLSIDLNSAFWAKMQKNIEKYPVHLCKGKSTKYTDL